MVYIFDLHNHCAAVMIAYLEYACALLEDDIPEITFVIAAYRYTSHFLIDCDMENGVCQCSAFTEVCYERPSRLFSFK